MNKFIKEQLKKCRVAIIPYFDDSTTVLHIGLSDGAVVKDTGELQLYHNYSIKVEDYIIHPYQGFTLHDNWNSGRIPTDYYMNCQIIKVMGDKMVKISAVGVNDRKPWEGWLPRKSIKILEEI